MVLRHRLIPTSLVTTLGLTLLVLVPWLLVTRHKPTSVREDPMKSPEDLSPPKGPDASEPTPRGDLVPQGESTISLHRGERVLLKPLGQRQGLFLERSELGFPSDLFPRLFVVDAAGDLYLVDPRRAPLLLKFRRGGSLVWNKDLSISLPGLLPQDSLQVAGLHFIDADTIAVVLRAVYVAEQREVLYLVQLSPGGTLKKTVKYAGFEFQDFPEDSRTWVDGRGRLWARTEGGTRLYSDEGVLLATRPWSPSWVVPSGIAYVMEDRALTRYDAEGRRLEPSGFQGQDGPRRLDAVLREGYLFELRSDEEVEGERHTIKRRLRSYHLERAARAIRYLGELALAPTVFESSRVSEQSRVIAVYEDALITGQDDQLYYVGRSDSQLWIEELKVRYAASGTQR